jgi:hypothetical protein
MGSGTGIRNAISKHGIENFRKDILEYFVSRDDMFAREKNIVTEEFVKDNTTYNNVVGGNKPPIGAFTSRTHSDKTKQKIKEARAKQKITPETKEKMKENHVGMLGKKHTTSTKQKISEANVGKILSDITKKKQSDALKGKKKSIVRCPWCDKEGGLPQMKQWHFDNCKNKEFK